MIFQSMKTTSSTILEQSQSPDKNQGKSRKRTLQRTDLRITGIERINLTLNQGDGDIVPTGVIQISRAQTIVPPEGIINPTVQGIVNQTTKRESARKVGPSGLSTGMSEANEVRCPGSTKRESARKVGPSGFEPESKRPKRSSIGQANPRAQ